MYTNRPFYAYFSANDMTIRRIRHKCCEMCGNRRCFLTVWAKAIYIVSVRKPVLLIPSFSVPVRRTLPALRCRPFSRFPYPYTGRPNALCPQRYPYNFPQTDIPSSRRLVYARSRRDGPPHRAERKLSSPAVSAQPKNLF